MPVPSRCRHSVIKWSCYGVLDFFCNFAWSKQRQRQLNMVKIGITHGDINGVGYEIIIKALEAEGMTEQCVPIIYGSAKVLAYYKKVLGVENFTTNQIESASHAKEGVVNLVNVTDEELKIDMGTPTPESGRAALLALDKAIEALKRGEIDAIVTAPINKHAIHSEEFPFTGHTEYLESKLGDDTADGKSALMILYSPTMRVALATTHLPISEVSSTITKELVIKRLHQINKSLIEDFAITCPRIAVLGLNPHCGDGGLLGNEEQTAILPAIEECFNEGIFAFGPFPADGFFGSGAFKKFDAILAMYHDQGLAPFKLNSAEEGVNFTAGLPYVRTSPDHGTAYDITGKNIADPESMRHAIFEAIDITRCRRRYARMSAHPLRKSQPDKTDRGERAEKSDRRQERQITSTES